MAAAREKAEKQKPKTKPDKVATPEPVEEHIEKPVKSSVGEIKLTVKPSIDAKPKKKAVNYYLPLSLIEEVECKAKKYNKKGSQLLEELLTQIIYDI